MNTNLIQLLFLGILFAVHTPLMAQQTFYVSPVGDDDSSN